MKAYEIRYCNFKHNTAYDKKEVGDSHLQDTKPRPVCILFTNKVVSTVIPLTSKNTKRTDLDTHIVIGEDMLLLEQITTVPTSVLDKKLFKKQFTEDEKTEIKNAIKALLD